jgi:kynurenine formamidase
MLSKSSRGIFKGTIMENYNCIDLSYSLSSSTIFWPGGEGFSLCLQCSTSADGSFYSAGTFTCAEHCGTHVDAPFHFNRHGQTVDLIPLESLIAPVYTIDIKDKCLVSRNYELQVGDITEFESQYGNIPEESIVLIRTGWSKYYHQGGKAYLGFDAAIDGPYDVANSQLSFPGLGVAASHALVDRKVAAVGLDTASLDPGSSKDFQAHRILLGAGIYGIENINGEIDLLPAVGASLFVMPMKIKGGSGAPARVVAAIPKII